MRLIRKPTHLRTVTAEHHKIVTAEHHKIVTAAHRRIITRIDRRIITHMGVCRRGIMETPGKAVTGTINKMRSIPLEAHNRTDMQIPRIRMEIHRVINSRTQCIAIQRGILTMVSSMHPGSSLALLHRLNPMGIRKSRFLLW